MLNSSRCGEELHVAFHLRQVIETRDTKLCPETDPARVSLQGFPKQIDEFFPNLRMILLRPHTVLRYPLSGGLTYRGFVPSICFGGLTVFDNLLSKFPALFPLFETIVLEKCAATMDSAHI